MLETVRGWIAQAQRIAVLTGAGVSAESGVPTFRDAQTGYWAQFNPQEMASERGFRAAPQRVWDWYEHRRAMLVGVQPNAGHQALAAFARRHPGRLALITQNVDGLHQRAGSEGVLCLHGDLAANRWLDRTTGDLRKFLRLLRGRQLNLPGRIDVSIAEHRKLMAAFEQRDAARAERAMHDHLMAQLHALKQLRALETRSGEAP